MIMAANVQQSMRNYTVKSVETVVEAADVKARIFTLAPGDVIPWNYHSETTDHYFVLSGELTTNTRAPKDRRTLAVGDRYQISAANPHMVSNRGPTDCQFLLLQGVGRYDWNSTEG
jgi:quercetin dioxygenase-like cupin family protein